MANGRRRREPVLDTPADAGALGFWLSPGDRAGGGIARRRSPRSPQGGGEPERGGPRRPAKRRGSILGRLVYASLVLGLWGFIAVAGIVAYYAAQLPPIDQLAVPKRPPNIAIMAGDGSLLANRGETGGGAGGPQGGAPPPPQGVLGVGGPPLF